METLPHPPSPTEAEIKIEEQQIRYFLFAWPRLLVFLLIVLGIIAAVAIACNFNVMVWLE